MANLTRYISEAQEDQDGYPVAAMLEHDEGEWVKFEDIKEFLKTPTNSDYAAALGIKVVVVPGLNGAYLLSDGDLRKLCERLNSALQNFA
jgi:hypothetical protein